MPDLEHAVTFFGEVIACELIFRMGPFHDDGAWFADELVREHRATKERGAERIDNEASIPAPVSDASCDAFSHSTVKGNSCD